MTVRELILLLMNCDMDSRVTVGLGPNIETNPDGFKVVNILESRHPRDEVRIIAAETPADADGELKALRQQLVKVADRFNIDVSNSDDSSVVLAIETNLGKLTSELMSVRYFLRGVRQEIDEIDCS